MPVRGGHVVDLALLFAELLGVPGVTQADLGRRYRKSAGYVSVVCRLGRALRELPPEERDTLRVPHFTLRAAQDLVSRHTDPAAIRAAAARLAAAPSARLPGGVSLGIASVARTRARQGTRGQWDRAPDGPDAIDPLPEPPDAMSRRGAFTYAWDAEAARRDPRAVLADFEGFVRATTDEVVRRLRHAAGDFGPTPLSAASPNRAARPVPGADRASAARPPEPAPVRADDADESSGLARDVDCLLPGGFNDAALRRLDARVADMLRAHRARMDAFLTERARGREARPAPSSGAPPGAPAAGSRFGPGPGGSFTPRAVDPAELDADLE